MRRLKLLNTSLHTHNYYLFKQASTHACKPIGTNKSILTFNSGVFQLLCRVKQFIEHVNRNGEIENYIKCILHLNTINNIFINQKEKNQVWKIRILRWRWGREEIQVFSCKKKNIKYFLVSFIFFFFFNKKRTLYFDLILKNNVRALWETGVFIQHRHK